MVVPAISLLFCICAVSSLRWVSSVPPAMCPPQSIDALQSKCSSLPFPNPPLEVNGDFLDRTLSFKREKNVYFSVLFHASWCPFSHDACLRFEALSSMFPQVAHLTIEQSSAMPSVFSRYGIHSFPAILMVNQTSRTRFRGSKDIHSLINFYRETTGFEAVKCVAEDQHTHAATDTKFILQSWIGKSLNEILTKEPFLLASVFFLCMRVLVFVLPKVGSHVRAFWISFVPHLKFRVFGETSQILGPVFRTINLKRIWMRLHLSKTRNFHEGAFWASSLASVSFGKASSSRLSSECRNRSPPS